MSERVIQVEQLSKRYRIGGQTAAYGTLRDAVASAVRVSVDALRGRRPASTETDFWALRDVSFEVRHGQALGIIGPNGAGKSTLLKILSRITPPTLGRAIVRGRVGSLLEVGTGFHPELTGRENVYLNGAILGMSKRVIDRKFDEIVAFAGVEPFLDTPVKRYSSGMYMRLGFAIAAHLEPDILIVDEVLAVGDAAFQKKCLGKMGEVAQEGRTVLFVSHNLVAVQGLCDRVIRLEHGKVAAEGQPAGVVTEYLQAAFPSLTQQEWDDLATAPGNDELRLHRVRLGPTDGAPSEPITMRTPLVLEFEFWNLRPGAHLDLNFQLITGQGIVAFASSPTDELGWRGRPFPGGLISSKCFIPGDLLIASQYRVLLTITRDAAHIVYQHPDVLVFEVHDAPELRGGWYGEMVGTVRPLLQWRTELIEGEVQASPGARPESTPRG
jgi:lipopolysaccharide transport system ATP-binding protein